MSCIREQKKKSRIFFKYGWKGKNLLLIEHTELTLSSAPLWYGEKNLTLLQCNDVNGVEHKTQ